MKSKSALDLRAGLAYNGDAEMMTGISPLLSGLRLGEPVTSTAGRKPDEREFVIYG
jgi:hypothetical protein